MQLKDKKAPAETHPTVPDRPSLAKLFVVVGIPAFNEENTIAKVIVGAQKHADVVVVCDDGSADLTAVIAERLGADVVRHGRNLGYGAALQSLFRRARELDADVLVTLDGDGQHDAAEVPTVAKPVVDGEADVVVGSRFLNKLSPVGMRWHRRAGVKFITRLTNSGSKNGGFSDSQSGFRAYSRKSLETLVLFEKGMGASVEILREAGKAGLRVCEVPVSCKYNNGDGVKTSTHNPVSHGVSVVMSLVKLVVEDRPLVFLGIPGVLCLLAGAFFGAWMLEMYAVGHQIVTNVALASIAFLLIGFFSLSTAITLYAIARLAARTNGKH
jgi:glycosyltransferase involved in cell wall biosynthesis